MTDEPWEDDCLQFARLLAEIRAVGLTHDQMLALSVSMNLHKDYVEEIFARAKNRFEEIKQYLDDTGNTTPVAKWVVGYNNDDTGTFVKLAEHIFSLSEDLILIKNTLMGLGWDPRLDTVGVEPVFYREG